METYDPDRAIDPVEWTTLDEGERQYLVERYHRRKRIKMPNLHMHAAIHVVYAVSELHPRQAVTSRPVSSRRICFPASK